MTEPVKLGIGILPTERVRDLLIGMSQSLAANTKTSYVLDGENFHPHLTLYQSEFPSYGVIRDDIGREAKNFSGEATIIPTSLGGWSDSFVFYDCKKTGGLQRLHGTILEKIFPLRAPAKSIAGSQGLSGLTADEAHAIERFGYPFVGPAFRPHFTIGRTMGKISIEKARDYIGNQEAALRGEQMTPTEIMVYKLGPDGSCVEIIERFPLGSS